MSGECVRCGEHCLECTCCQDCHMNVGRNACRIWNGEKLEYYCLSCLEKRLDSMSNITDSSI